MGAAEILNHLRGAGQTEGKSWSSLKKVHHPRVEGLATNAAIVAFKVTERAVLGIEFVDRRLAALGIGSSTFWVGQAVTGPALSLPTMR